MALCTDDIPPLCEYQGKTEFFEGGKPPLSEAIGYLVVLGFGAAFSIFTSLLVFAEKYFSGKGPMTSEHFK